MLVFPRKANLYLLSFKRKREKEREKKKEKEREREREREKECVENGADTLLASIAASTIKIIHV